MSQTEPEQAGAARPADAAGAPAAPARRPRRERPVVRHAVGHEGEFELNEFRISELQGASVGVVKTAKGFYAVRNSCPHMAGEICRGTVGGTMLPSEPGQYEWSDDTLVVACPWHRWEFTLDTGESYQGITDRKLMTYKVEIDPDGQVFVLMKGRPAR